VGCLRQVAGLVAAHCGVSMARDDRCEYHALVTVVVGPVLMYSWMRHKVPTGGSLAEKVGEKAAGVVEMAAKAIEMAEAATAITEAVAAKGAMVAAMRAGCSVCRAAEHRSSPHRHGFGR